LTKAAETASPTGSKDSNNSGVVVGISAGVVALLAGILAVRRRVTKEDSTE
jgi:LPXTG-motif cell wall-anchored protein